MYNVMYINILINIINMDWYNLVNKSVLFGNLLSSVNCNGNLSYTSRKESPEGLLREVKKRNPKR